MNSMLIVVLMVFSCILVNPFVSASEPKDVAAMEQTQDESEFDDNEEIEDEEELSN